jgi:hypothetical protein
MKKQESEQELSKKQKPLISQGLCRLEGQIIELFYTKSSQFEVVNTFNFLI